MAGGPDLRPPPPEDLQALFTDRLEAARATWERIGGLADAPAAVARFLSSQNLPARLTVAPDLAGALDFSATPLTIDDALPAEDGVAVLTGCAGAVAETGTFVAVSGEGRDPRLNYLAETLIVVVDAGRIAASYEDVWGTLGEVPRLVSFITGASRTADIEQTIEWGAHGPRRLHVLIADGA
jgi:L-lactate dehydrogenase complex protein LldG